MNKLRLLNVAKALRESKYPTRFSMRRFGDDCGTPACALGHYAVRRDLQGIFTLNKTGYLRRIKGREDGVSGVTDSTILRHFGITHKQAFELFRGDSGCGGALTTTQAADYIEKFVERHS